MSEIPTKEEIVYPSIPGARIRVVSQDFAEVIIPYARLMAQKEQWQREAFAAAKTKDLESLGGIRQHVIPNDKYGTFEDWKKTQ